MYIRDLTAGELRIFGEITGRLQRVAPHENVRSMILGDLITLLRADTGSSFVWQESARRFCGSYYLGMMPDMPALYDEWFQFHDPMTFKMRSRRQATIVDEVLNRSHLATTEFYNDFLRRDAHEYGINVYSFDEQGRDLGDFRIWRRRGRENFGDREKMLLDVLEPFIRMALLEARGSGDSLTARERDVTELLSRGCTDRDIARILGISFGTVRTHVNRALEKLCCANRAELAATFVKAARS